MLPLGLITQLGAQAISSDMNANTKGPGAGPMPNPGTNYPGYGPNAYPGWPVPPATVSAPKQNFKGDLSTPGAAETYFDQHKGSFGAPGALSDYWGQNKSGFGQPGAADQYWNGIMGSGQTHPPKSTNYAEQAYQNYSTSSPADTTPYYDEANRRAAEQINKAYSARGMGRSSAALDQLSEAAQGIAGQKAQADANYGLQRGGLLGNLAAGADLSSSRGTQNNLSWLTGLGNLGLGVQNADLNRLMGGGQLAQGLDSQQLASLAAGMTGALGAQNALRNRGQDLFENNMAYGNATASPMERIYSQMLMGDQGLQEQQLAMAMGVPREALNQDFNNAYMGMMNKGASGAMGGGGGGLLGLGLLGIL